MPSPQTCMCIVGRDDPSRRKNCNITVGTRHAVSAVFIDKFRYTYSIIVKLREDEQ